ncbi:hypothetical protein CDAR_111801 [Caerostris darwini]|uniref:Uncharacterized protein n=1 Tax=Caerostris darwini TaxID=1538125 RepID=A0AAV4Q544_9ARAC|nr:hypothetical protein CDAR_111801 [Caerostris darwini]
MVKRPTCSRGGSLGQTRASPWVGFRRRPPQGPGSRRRSSTGRRGAPLRTLGVEAPVLDRRSPAFQVIIRPSTGLSQISPFILLHNFSSVFLEQTC